jgi:PDZ domain-containing protein
VLRSSALAVLGSAALLVGGVIGQRAGLMAQQSGPDRIETRQETKADAEVQRWIEQLGDADFEKRDRAIESLRARGKSVLPALEEAAEKADDAELRWNARRLARDLREERGGRTLRRSPRPAEPDAKDETDLESAFDLDFGPAFQGFGDLRRRIEQMQEEMRNLEGRLRTQAPGAAFRSSSDGVEVRVEPGRVRVKVREKTADGEEKVETYEAPSMEDFRDKYPEIAEKYLGNFKLNLGDWTQGMHPRAFALPSPFGPMDPLHGDALEPIIGPENGERLGVNVAPLGAEAAPLLGIPPGQGFRVESVEPGSLADSLGLKPNDVVLSIGGKKIGTETTVREALASLKVGDPVKVEVLRLSPSRSTLEAKKTAMAERSEGRELKPVTGEKPRRLQR